MLEWAIKFAMLIAPALTADLCQDSELTQLCIPIMVGSGLDMLGETVVEQGELMLRSFVRVVKRLLDETDPHSEDLVVKAIRHKAESVEILGERWFSKACQSDREAAVILDPRLSRPKQKRVYCYLGGGGLSEASTWLAQGVVVRAKSWREAAAVVTAIALLTSCTPGETVRMESEFVTLKSDVHVSNDGLLDTEGEVEKAEADWTGPKGEAPIAHFCGLCQASVSLLAGLINIPLDSLEVGRVKSVEEAKANLGYLRGFLEM